MSVCLCVCLSVPYRSPHRSSDCDETFTSCCKYSRGCFGNLKNLKIVLARVPGVALPEAHTIQPIAMKLSQVVNMLGMVWRNKNIKKLSLSVLYIKMNVCLSVCLSRIGAHTVHPIAMKLSQVVVNIPGVVLEI